MRDKPGFSHEYQREKICSESVSLHVKLLVHASVGFHLTYSEVSCALAWDWRTPCIWQCAPGQKLVMAASEYKAVEINGGSLHYRAEHLLPSIHLCFGISWSTGSVTSTRCSQPQIAIYEPVPKTKIHPVLCLWCILILHKLHGIRDGVCSAIQEGQAADSGISVGQGWRLLGEHCVSELSVTNSGPFSLDSKNNCFHWKNNGESTHLIKKVTWEGVWGMRNPFLTSW